MNTIAMEHQYKFIINHNICINWNSLQNVNFNKPATQIK